MLSDERYKALLRGDKPQNEMEAKWLKSFEEEEAAHLKKMVESDQMRLQEIEQAYREFYDLLMATIPQDFLYKTPFKVDEIDSIASKIDTDANNKMWDIFLNPVLRKLNGLPFNRSPFPDDEKPLMDEITNKFIHRTFKKQYNIDIKSLEKKYYSYLTNDFIDKVQELEEKYDVILSIDFDICDYLSNWQRYNV